MHGVHVGERLRAIRRQKGLSLHDVEARSSLEFKASVLGAYERGERAISVPRLLRLAEIYEVPADQLLPARARRRDQPHRAARDSSTTGFTIDLVRLHDARRPRRAVLVAVRGDDPARSARTSTAACSRSAATTCGCSPRCWAAAPTTSASGSTSSASAPA